MHGSSLALHMSIAVHTKHLNLRIGLPVPPMEETPPRVALNASIPARAYVWVACVPPAVEHCLGLLSFILSPYSCVLSSPFLDIQCGMTHTHTAHNPNQIRRWTGSKMPPRQHLKQRYGENESAFISFGPVVTRLGPHLGGCVCVCVCVPGFALKLLRTHARATRE